MKMAIRTDLALEAAALCGDRLPKKEWDDGGCHITKIEIKSDEQSRISGKPKGVYLNIEVGNIATGAIGSEGVAETLSRLLSSLLPEFSKVLFVGLGNPHLTADALGPKTAEGVLATRHIERHFAESIGLKGLRSVAVMAPGVLGQTGMEAAEIVRAAIKTVEPDAVIVVDALAAADVSRLGKTVQMNNFGIAPGSGVGNRRKELSCRTLGVPTVALGIPTVAATENDDLIITSRDIDLLIKQAGELLAQAVNFSLQCDIDREILLSLV
jgi:spore protease